MGLLHLFEFGPDDVAASRHTPKPQFGRQNYGTTKFIIQRIGEKGRDSSKLTVIQALWFESTLSISNMRTLSTRRRNSNREHTKNRTCFTHKIPIRQKEPLLGRLSSIHGALKRTDVGESTGEVSLEHGQDWHLNLSKAVTRVCHT